MANSNDDLTTGFEYLNAMPSDYDLSVQQPIDDQNFNDAAEMFMDPNFWTMGIDDGGVSTSPNQPISPFGLSTINNAIDQKFSSSAGSANIQQQASYPVELAATVTTPAGSAENASSNKPSSIKRESVTKRSSSIDDSKDRDKDVLAVSAEEDKRRRNTAASARFRVKKKLREQAMEKTAKEMTDKCTALETRVKELEKENRLLKGLLTEKAGKGKGEVRFEAPSSDEDSTIAQSSKRFKPSRDER